MLHVPARGSPISIVSLPALSTPHTLSAPTARTSPVPRRASWVTTRKSLNAPADTHASAEGDGSTEAVRVGASDGRVTATQSAQGEGMGDALVAAVCVPIAGTDGTAFVVQAARRTRMPKIAVSRRTRAHLDGTHRYDGSPSVTVIAPASRYAPLTGSSPSAAARRRKYSATPIVISMKVSDAVFEIIIGRFHSATP